MCKTSYGMLEGIRGMCKTYSRLLRRKIKCKKREEKMEKRAVSCKQAVGEYICLSPVHGHSTVCPCFLVNSIPVSSHREKGVSADPILCVCVAANSSQTSWQMGCLAWEVDSGVTKSGPAWRSSGHLCNLDEHCLCVSGAASDLPGVLRFIGSVSLNRHHFCCP